MSYKPTLFGFRGRMARLPYFGYGLLFLGLCVFLILVWVGLIATGVVGLIILGSILMWVVCGWMGLALTIKRLHDLGLSGYHMIWIFGLSVVAGQLGSPTSSEAIGILSGLSSGTIGILSSLASLASLIVTLWLLFAPGQPRTNGYGPPPGTLRPPGHPCCRRLICRAADANGDQRQRDRGAQGHAARRRPPRRDVPH